MIHHDTRTYGAFLQEDEPAIAEYQHQQLAVIDTAASAMAERQIELLRAEGSMFTEEEVYTNQYNRYIRLLGSLGAHTGALHE